MPLGQHFFIGVGGSRGSLTLWRKGGLSSGRKRVGESDIKRSVSWIGPFTEWQRSLLPSVRPCPSFLAGGFAAVIDGRKNNRQLSYARQRERERERERDEERRRKIDITRKNVDEEEELEEESEREKKGLRRRRRNKGKEMGNSSRQLLWGSSDVGDT